MHFDLTHMIQKYGTDIKVERVSEGGYEDDGTFVPPSREMFATRGIVSVFRDDEVEHAEGGRYDTDRVKLYINELIHQSDIVHIDGRAHTVAEHRDYSHLAQPYIYGLKRRDNP